MEGHAVAAVGAAYGVPVAEVRAVSNAIGRRDRDGWDLPAAFAALAAAGPALAALADGPAPAADGPASVAGCARVAGPALGDGAVTASGPDRAAVTEATPASPVPATQPPRTPPPQTPPLETQSLETQP
jgi:hypothetical protein